MEYRFLGQTGVRVSRLCFGAMSFGNEADAKTSAALFARARDAGINFFDTADVYASGASERMLGQLVRGCRDEIVLSTKGYFATGGDVNARGASRYHLVRAVEDSLRRLGTDRIDVYFLHRFDDETSVEETWRAIDDLVSAGKILYPAVSNYSAWQAMKTLGIARQYGWAPPVCFQPMYNLVKRQAEAEILPLCQSEGLGAIVYGPTAGGLLTGKYGADRRPDLGRLVDNKMYGVRYHGDAYYRVAGEFCEFAAELSSHPAALAIAWVLHHPAVTASLIGMRTVEHLETALEALDISLSKRDYQRIAEMWPAPPPATDRNEESSEHNYGSR
jgi:aryl-alcohol dehydrogenase-like predicted oxidoreductase